MVEGIVVISVMLGFLGLIQWVQRAYGMKLDRQQDLRSDVLYNASHACSDSAKTEPGGQIANQPGSGTGPNNGSAQYSTSWNVAKATDTQQVSFFEIVDANATTPGRGISLMKKQMTSTVKSRSTCICNEKKYDSQLTAWIQFAGNWFKNAGGFASLISTPF